MKLGPVLSETYSYICDLKANYDAKKKEPSDYWENYFEVHNNNYIWVMTT